MSNGDIIIVPVKIQYIPQKKGEPKQVGINFELWENYYGVLRNKMPQTYKLGQKASEILALKYLLNKYFWGDKKPDNKTPKDKMPSRTLNEDSNIADENFFKTLGILSIACGAVCNYSANTFTVTKELLQKFENPETLASFRQSDIYKIAKKCGLKKIPSNYIKYRIARQEQKKVQNGKKKLQSARGKCYNMADVYQIITPATKKVLENASQRCGFNLNKLIEKAAQTSQEYDFSIEDFLNALAESYLLFGIDPALIASIIEVESNFNDKKISDKDAYGLMQVTNIAYETVKQVYGFPYNYISDNRQNILCGAAYLKISLDSLDSFEGKKTLALAAYNAGLPTIAQHKGIPSGKNYIQTKEFVKNVLNVYKTYRI